MITEIRGFSPDFLHYCLSTNSWIRYVVDPLPALSRVLAETDAQGSVTASYVYGLGLISKIVGEKAYFYQYDGLGSTVAMTDTDGTVVNTYAYDEFGQVATNVVETVANPFQYVGRWGVMTEAPDLLYMRARHYVPSLGRFLQKDPLGFVGGDLNLYSYVGNNPVNFVDPLGLLEYPQDEIEEDWGTTLLAAGAIATGSCALPIIRAAVASGGRTLFRSGIGRVPQSPTGKVWRIAIGGEGSGLPFHIHIHRYNWWRILEWARKTPK